MSSTVDFADRAEAVAFAFYAAFRTLVDVKSRGRKLVPADLQEKLRNLFFLQERWLDES